jgi:hypothetical protein
MRRRMCSFRAIQGDSGRFRAIQAYSSLFKPKKLFNLLIVNPPTLSAPRFGRIPIF